MAWIISSLNKTRTAADPATNTRIRPPKIDGAVDYNVETEARISKELATLDINVVDYMIDVDRYRKYFHAAEYVSRYPEYYKFNRAEKSLEHFIAADILKLDKNDVYIDIASEHSPVPDIYTRLFGCKSYRQDLAYPPGLNGDRIGGDAANMPVGQEFATRMALHCSFEHFEGDADVKFIREVDRVLCDGGMLCCVPLYLFDTYAIQTDPDIAVREHVEFEPDAVVYCAEGWGNRHGRFYDPIHFKKRVVDSLGNMRLTVYHIQNTKDVDPSCYARFAFLIEK